MRSAYHSGGRYRTRWQRGASWCRLGFRIGRDCCNRRRWATPTGSPGQWPPGNLRECWRWVLRIRTSSRTENRSRCPNPGPRGIDQRERAGGDRDSWIDDGEPWLKSRARDYFTRRSGYKPKLANIRFYLKPSYTLFWSVYFLRKFQIRPLIFV